MSVETAEREATFERASAALAEYRQTDQRIPCGALTLDRTEYLIAGAAPGAEGLSVDNQRDLGWLYFEHAMATYNTPSAAKESQRRSEAQAVIERSRQMFRNIIHNPHATGGCRARARYELASLTLYEGFCTRKLMIDPGGQKKYADLLTTLTRDYQEYFGPDDAKEAHMVAALALFAMGDASRGDVPLLALPAPTRVDWDMNVYEPRPLAVPKHVFLTEIGDEVSATADDLVITFEQLIPEFDDKEDFGIYPALGAYAETVRTYEIHSTSKFFKDTRTAALIRFKTLYAPLLAVAAPLRNDIRALPTPEVIIPTIILPETVVEQRTVLPEVNWYLNDFDGQVDQDFIDKVRRVESHRSEHGLLPQEQRALGWMQFALASAIAEKDDDASRKQFEVAGDTFLRAAKGFIAARQPGDACDALMVGEAMDVYRTLCTSKNRHVPVKAADRYAANLAVALTPIKSEANQIKGADEQFAQLLLSTQLATLILLQTGAEHSGLRHVVLPVPPHAYRGVQVDALLYRLTYNDSFGEYDTANPLTITFVSGDIIDVSPGHINLGINNVVSADDPLGRLVALAQRQAVTGKRSKQVKKSSGKKSQAPDSADDFAATFSNAMADALD